jgi:hypothetical protein
MTTQPIPQRDFILEGEHEEYARTVTALMTELSPGSVLEQTFATEIMGATWRLRRCGVLEFDLARSTDPLSTSQQSIDRARAQSYNILRRSLAELRKLQTERHARILQMPDATQAGSSFCKPAQATAVTPEKPAPEKPAGSSFCKTAATPRNALCPCGSGTKYKRCCGQNAPPVLNS